MPYATHIYKITVSPVFNSQRCFKNGSFGSQVISDLAASLGSCDVLMAAQMPALLIIHYQSKILEDYWGWTYNTPMPIKLHIPIFLGQSNWTFHMIVIGNRASEKSRKPIHAVLGGHLQLERIKAWCVPYLQ